MEQFNDDFGENEENDLFKQTTEISRRSSKYMSNQHSLDYNLNNNDRYQRTLSLSLSLRPSNNDSSRKNSYKMSDFPSLNTKKSKSTIQSSTQSSQNEYHSFPEMNNELSHENSKALDSLLFSCIHLISFQPSRNLKRHSILQSTQTLSKVKGRSKFNIMSSQISLDYGNSSNTISFSSSKSSNSTTYQRLLPIVSKIPKIQTTLKYFSALETVLRDRIGKLNQITSSLTLSVEEEEIISTKLLPQLQSRYATIVAMREDYNYLLELRKEVCKFITTSNQPQLSPLINHILTNLKRRSDYENRHLVTLLTSSNNINSWNYMKFTQLLCNIEAQLECLLGCLRFQLCGLDGMSSLNDGDNYELYFSYAAKQQRWSAKGKILSLKTRNASLLQQNNVDVIDCNNTNNTLPLQRWEYNYDGDYMIIFPKLQESSLLLKIFEVNMLGMQTKKGSQEFNLLKMLQLENDENFNLLPMNLQQEPIANLNATRYFRLSADDLGSIKLYVKICWAPLDEAADSSSLLSTRKFYNPYESSTPRAADVIAMLPSWTATNEDGIIPTDTHPRQSISLVRQPSIHSQSTLNGTESDLDDVMQTILSILEELDENQFNHLQNLFDIIKQCQILSDIHCQWDNSVMDADQTTKTLSAAFSFLDNTEMETTMNPQVDLTLSSSQSSHDNNNINNLPGAGSSSLRNGRQIWCQMLSWHMHLCLQLLNNLMECCEWSASTNSQSRCTSELSGSDTNTLSISSSTTNSSSLFDSHLYPANLFPWTQDVPMTKQRVLLDLLQDQARILIALHSRHDDLISAANSSRNANVIMLLQSCLNDDDAVHVDGLSAQLWQTAQNMSKDDNKWPLFVERDLFMSCMMQYLDNAQWCAPILHETSLSVSHLFFLRVTHHDIIQLNLSNLLPASQFFLSSIGINLEDHLKALLFEVNVRDKMKTTDEEELINVLENCETIINDFSREVMIHSVEDNNSLLLPIENHLLPPPPWLVSSSSSSSSHDVTANNHESVKVIKKSIIDKSPIPGPVWLYFAKLFLRNDISNRVLRTSTQVLQLAAFSPIAILRSSLLNSLCLALEQTNIDSESVSNRCGALSVIVHLTRVYQKRRQNLQVNSTTETNSTAPLWLQQISLTDGSVTVRQHASNALSAWSVKNTQF